jgi:Caspase domain
MKKLFIFGLISISFFSCDNKVIKQALLDAEKIVQRKQQPIQEHDTAISILERCKRNDNDAINLKLAQYYYELGRLQEESYQTATTAAIASFRTGSYAIQRLGSDMTKYSTLVDNLNLAYTRCLVRIGDTNMWKADSIIKKMKYQLENSDSILLELNHLRAFFNYKIPLHENDLKALKQQLEDKDDDEAKDKAHKQNAFYLGLTCWVLAKTASVKKTEYITDAIKYFKESERYLPNFPETYHILGKFYNEQAMFKKAEAIFKAGNERNTHNWIYKVDYMTALLNPIESELQYNFFNNIEPYLPTIQIAERFFEEVVKERPLQQDFLNKPSIQTVYKWHYWMCALQHKSVELPVPQVMYADNSNNTLKYYMGLYWKNRNTNTALEKWRESSEASGNIGAMSHFWLGYYAETDEDKSYHFDQALQKSDSKYQDAWYFKGLLIHKKKWKKTECFDNVLNINADYALAREKRAYISLQKGDKQAAAADFDYLCQHSKDSFQFKGMIGKGFLNPKSLDLSRFQLKIEHYDMNTFLESYFYLRQYDEDDKKFSRYDYFNKYINDFKEDKNVSFIIKDLVKSYQKKIKPIIAWHMMSYNPNLDTIHLYIKKKRKVNPIKFSLPNTEIFKRVKVYLNQELLYDSLQVSTQHYKIAIPYSFIKEDTFATIQIVAYLKNPKKFGRKGLDSITSEKQIAFKLPNTCKCVKKLAFIIQNNQYQTESYKLKKAPYYNETEQMKALLTENGFDTLVHRDLTTKQFQKLLQNDYKDSVRTRNYDLILFYYTGHGISYKDKNYLLPTDYNEKDTLLISTASIYATVKGTFDDSNDSLTKNTALVYIFDACRNPILTATIEDDDNAKEQLIQQSVVVHTTRMGEYADATVENPLSNGDRTTLKTLFTTHLPKNFGNVEADDTDILELLDIRDYIKGSDKVPEISHNLNCQILILGKE